MSVKPVQPIPTTFRKSFISGKALLSKDLGHHRINFDFHSANPMKKSERFTPARNLFNEVRLIEFQTVGFISEEK